MPHEEIDPKIAGALHALWNDPREVHLAMRGRDAWVTCAIIQFACRNPALNPAQRETAERVGRVLAGAVAALAPDLAPTLELGWDAAFDVPRKKGAA